MAVNHHHHGGAVRPLEALRARVGALIGAICVGDQKLTGRELPGVIHDLHASIAAGREVPQLLDLAVLLHTQGTIGWLRTAGASVDLREQAALVARRVAEGHDTRSHGA